MRSRLPAVSLLILLSILARPLSPAVVGTPREVENRAAFARLLSLVRFFHPSDQAAAVDWNRMAVAGFAASGAGGAIAGTADPVALARALESYFRPLAPTLRVIPTGQKAEIPAELRTPAGPGPFRIVTWRHFGGHFDSPAKIYSAERIDDHAPPGFATLVQAVAPGGLLGRRVRLRARVRTALQPGGSVRLGLRVDRPGGKPGFLGNRPVQDGPWQSYEIEGEVAPDAERIVVLLVLTGGGKAWLDDVAITPLMGGDSGGDLPNLANAGFESGEPGAQPPGWYFPYESIRAGYHLLLRRGEPCQHGGCAEIASDEVATPRIPRPSEVLEIDLGAGVTAALPPALWADAAGTLPHAAPGAPGDPPPPWTGVDPAATAADTRETRLATVALLWGIEEHFHPELDPTDPAWQAALPAALAAADSSEDRESFRRVLRRLLVPLQDTWALNVTWRGEPRARTLPLAWAWVEDRLVVTGVAAVAASSATGGLAVGDVITTLDGRPAAAVLAEAEALVSAPAAARRALALDLLAQGPAGSRVELGVESAGALGGRPFTVTLARAAAEPPADTPLAPVAEPRPGLLYVDLRRITDAELEKLLPRLAAARGVVFDLRGASDVSTVLLSHLAERTVRSANWQIPVVMLPDHRDVKWMSTFWTIDPKAPHLGGKLAFLADGRSLHYSETLLEMVASSRWAEIVGEPSGGDDGSLDGSFLPGGWKVSWSGQRTLRQDGSPFHGVGVPPTVPAHRTLRGIAAGRDEVVERGLDVVGGS
jgi:C-terminal processing protease CtpA/Prc